VFRGLRRHPLEVFGRKSADHLAAVGADDDTVDGLKPAETVDTIVVPEMITSFAERR